MIEGDKAENPSDERNIVDGEASGINVSVQPEDLCMNLVETEEPAQIGTVGDASDRAEDDMAIDVLGEKEESKDRREHLSSALSSVEDNKAENPSDGRNMIDINPSVQPEDLSRSLGETEGPAQMGEVGDASDHSEDNVAVSVLGEKEESNDQREHLSSELSSGEQTKADNPSDEKNMIDGEASGMNASVQPEDMSRSLIETEEPAQMGKVGDAGDHSENVPVSVLGEKEESQDQQEHLSIALSSEEENKAENPSDDRDMIHGEASGKNVPVQPEDLPMNLVETEEPTQVGEVGNASDQPEDKEKEESNDQGEHLSSALRSVEETKAENTPEEINMTNGEASGINVSVQPEDLSRSLFETEEPTQMEEVGNASDLFEDNIGVLEEKEESKDQREPLSSALSSEEENKAENPSDDTDMIGGEASGINVSVEPEDLSRNLVKTDESTQMEEVGKAGDQSEDNVAGVLEEKEESNDQQEHMSSALSSEKETKAENTPEEINMTKAENTPEEINMTDGEASGINVSVQPEDLSMNLVETEEPTQTEEAGNASGQSEDNVAIGVLEEKEESKEQEEHLSSALSSEEENKAENPSEDRDMIDGEASVQPENVSTNLDETEEPTQMGEVGNASDQSEDNVATGVLEEKEESEGQQEHLSSALSSQKENEESLPVEDPTVGGLDEPEAKCSVSESDVEGDGKKCVGTSESADLDSEAPPESVSSISAAIEPSSEPSNSLVPEESKSEELKDVADV